MKIRFNVHIQSKLLQVAPNHMIARSEVKVHQQMFKE